MSMCNCNKDERIACCRPASDEKCFHNQDNCPQCKHPRDVHTMENNDNNPVCAQVLFDQPKVDGRYRMCNCRISFQSVSFQSVTHNGTSNTQSMTPELEAHWRYQLERTSNWGYMSRYQAPWLKDPDEVVWLREEARYQCHLANALRGQALRNHHA